MVFLYEDLFLYFQNRSFNFSREPDKQLDIPKMYKYSNITHGMQKHAASASLTLVPQHDMKHTITIMHWFV